MLGPEVLGPDGVDALKDALVDLEGTTNGLRNLAIGLALTNVAVFAIVLGMWQKLHPVEDVATEGSEVWETLDLPMVEYSSELPASGNFDGRFVLLYGRPDESPELFRFRDGEWSKVNAGGVGPVTPT